MSITTTTTKITRRYLEGKTKSDLAQMYLDLLEDDIRLEFAAKVVAEAADYEEEGPTGFCVVPVASVYRLRKLVGLSDEGVPVWARLG